MAEQATYTHTRLARVILIPLSAVGLPVVEGEVFDRIYAWLMPHNGFGGGSPIPPIAMALFSLGNAQFIVIMVPWLVLAVVMWRRSPSITIWLTFGALIGVVYSCMRLSYLVSAY